MGVPLWTSRWSAVTSLCAFPCVVYRGIAPTRARGMQISLRVRWTMGRRRPPESASQGKGWSGRTYLIFRTTLVPDGCWNKAAPVGFEAYFFTDAHAMILVRR